MLHIPLLRHGKAYRSLDVVRVLFLNGVLPLGDSMQTPDDYVRQVSATNHIQWDQPHEGNLFDHLYAHRAFQRAIVS